MGEGGRGWQGGRGQRGRETCGLKSPIPNPQSLILAFPLPYAIAGYACIGVAVLGKGPVGMLLPLAAMGLFLLAINGWRSLFRSAWWMRPFTVIVVIAAVAVPWYVAVGYANRLGMAEAVLPRVQSAAVSEADPRPRRRQFARPRFGRAGLDLVLLLLCSRHSGRLLPLVGVPGADAGRYRSTTEGRKKGTERKREEKRGKRGRSGSGGALAGGVVLALCWFGTWFVLWSLVKTKLPHYLLPAYPALALLTACFIDRWLAAEKGSDHLPEQPGGGSHKSA